MKQLFYPMLLSMLLISTARAQTYNPNVNENDGLAIPSPGISYNQTGVQEATGRANIGISLFNLTQDAFTHPISLNYNSGGLKVDESASRVGMGWSLAAGGSITRVVCGYPDDDPQKGLLVPPASSYLPYENLGVMNSLYNGQYDGESDYYVFQAGDFSGKFFYKNGKFYSMPKSNEIIEKGNFLGIENSFRITDGNGVQYYFTEREKISLSNNKSAFQFQDRVNTWLLTKIVFLNLTEMTFNYGEEKQFWVRGGTVEKSKYLKLPAFCPNALTDGSYFKNEIWYYYKTKLLENITYSFGKLEIQYAQSQRQDIPGDYAIQSVFLRNSSNQIIKRFNFDFYYRWRSYGLFSSPESKRLMLGSITEIANETGTFPPYLFEYNDKTDYFCLPAPGTPSQDLYGYFNGENASGGYFNNSAPTLMKEYSYDYQPDTMSSATVTDVIPGATRNINSYFNQAMILKKIVFPSGAVNEFEYENNKYLNFPGTGESDGPGLRLRLLKTDDGNGNKTYKKYTYENGICTDFRRFDVREVNAFAWCYISNFQVNKAKNIAIVRSSTPRSLIPGIYSSQIYYGKVTTEEVNESGSNLNGKIVNEYYADRLKSLLIKEQTGPSTFIWRDTRELWCKPYFYGNLLKSQIYAREGDSSKLIQEIEYTYNLDEPTEQTVSSLYPRPNKIDNIYYLKFQGSIINDGFHSAKYCSQVFHLNKITKKEWGTSGNLSSNTISEFEFEPSAQAVHMKPISIKTTFADGSTLTNRFKRVSDYGSPISLLATDEASQSLLQMLNNNQMSECVEQVTIKNEGTSSAVILSGKLTEFCKPATGSFQVSAKREYQLKHLPSAASYFSSSIISGYFSRNPNYYQTAEILKFNKRGFGISYATRAGKNTQILNAYNELVLADAGNASAEEIGYCGFESYEFEMPVLTGTVSLRGGNFTFSFPSAINPLTNDGFAGNVSLQLGSSTSLTGDINLNLLNSKKYVLTLWCKNGNPTLTVNGVVQTADILQSHNGWTLLQFEFYGNNNISISGNCLVDEVKIRPLYSQIVNKVYNNKSQLVAESDNNNKYLFYQYDNFGRQFRIYDIDKNLLKQISYQIQANQN